MLLADDTAIVTGAGSPIGRAIALAVAREGAKVVGTDIAVELGQATVSEIAANRGVAAFFPADLSDATTAQRLFDFAIAELGRVSLFVHCASPNHFGANLARS